MAEQSVKKIWKVHKWFVWGICISLFMALVYTLFYRGFQKEAEANIQNPIETVESMNYIYKNCYVLYRDLYNSQNEEKLDFVELYLQPSKHTDTKLLEHVRYFERHGYVDNGGYIGLTDEEAKVPEGYDGYLKTDALYELIEITDRIESSFRGIENDFGSLNAMFDYVAEDTKTGEVITNLSNTDISMDNQAFYLSFLFDENGNVTIDGEVTSDDSTKARKNAYDAMRNYSLQEFVGNPNDYRNYQEYAQLKMPVNCRITFAINKTDWQQLTADNYSVYYDSLYNSIGYYYSPHRAYNNTDSGEIYMLLLLLMGVLGFLFPTRFLGDGWKVNKLCKPKLEILVVFGFVVVGFGSCVVNLVCWVCSRKGIYSLATVMPVFLATFLVYAVNILALTALFCGAWYVGVCARMLRELGWKEYLKQYFGIYQIFPYIKRKLLAVYEEAVHFDVTRNANKLILKIVIVNAVILFIIGSLWVGGFGIAIVYSLILYFILRKYISDLQKKYSILLKATNEIAEGNLNVDIKEDLGVFEPFKPQVIRIQEGFKRAVEEEVKSQRLKSELITNVSHDLKTPLTAIITYINLLQDESITEEQRKEYLETLERKSLRLKVLIEDLFEVSKATSQNVTLNIMDIDIINLIKQVQIEMSDKLNAANLDVRMQLPEEKCILPLDSQKTYRIFENLFGNIAKYALPGTRVYVTGRILERKSENENDNILKEKGANSVGEYRTLGSGIEITLKNITAEELNVTPEELTERFVRGDASRNTEGSGLGLAIAKSFTELQGGKFEIQLDGDLFKVTISFS